MNDFWEAKKILEAATPEDPVKLRFLDGAGQHVDIWVSDATVDIKPHNGDAFVVVMEEDEELKIDMQVEYDNPEDHPCYDEYWDSDGGPLNN